MRTALLKKGNIAAIVALAALLLALRSALLCAAFASDDSSSLTERHVWFTYGYTECTGDVHPVSDSGVESGESDGTAYPEYYSTYMMACDTDHKLRLAGDVAADDDVTFSSSNPSVLEIDGEGNVTLMRTGTARVTATVAANEVYDQCTIYLDIKIDRHTGRIETVRPHYTDRPEAWGLDLDTSDGPHQLTMLLRPGARVKYSSENQNVAYVSGKGVVTPVSAGTTQIFFDIDDAEGRYKACRFGLTINITGEAIPDDLLPKDRDVWFTYECTDCLGKSCSVEREQMGYDVSSPYFGVDMMLCDTAHKIHVEGEDVTADNVTLTALDPDVLTVDSAGNVMLLKAGRGRIKATVAEDNKYKESSIYLAVTVDRHDGWIGTSPVYFEGSPFGGLQLDTADGPQKLVVPLRPGAGVSCSIDDPNVAIVDPDGTVTPVSAGTAQIRFDVDDGGGRYKAGFFTETIRVTGEDLRSSQEITGDQGPFIIDVHDGLKLSLQAKTSLEYSICSGMGIASVNQSGMVSFTQAGTVSVRVRAVQSRDYKPAEIIIKITARDYAAEEAARIAEEEAAQKAAEEAAARKAAEEEAAQKAAAEEAEAKRAAEETAAQKAPVASAQKTSVKKKSSKVVLKRPTFKVRALKGRKIKLTWSKVAGADGYVVYVKYPGSKKYVKAVTKNATVKSVTHRGLSKNRVYRYKVRAYKKVKGKRIYSPFSKGRKARVR